MSDELTPDELAELKRQYAKLYTHPIARLIADHERLLAEREQNMQAANIAYNNGISVERQRAAEVCDARAAEWGSTGPLPRGGYHGDVPLPTHLQTEAELCAAAIRQGGPPEWAVTKAALGEPNR